MATASKKSQSKGKAGANRSKDGTRPDAAAEIPRAKTQPAVAPETRPWKAWYSWALLGVFVIVALLPFSNRAFHIDDTLFMFAGKHIVQDPGNPYGFTVNWDNIELPMSQVTKNPPLTCYYIALVGSIAGWSERALHLAFLLPALASALLTYRLARRFTRAPLVAAFAAVATPGFLVSAASVMCDTMMVAIWLLCIELWLEALETEKPALYAASAVLMGVATVTKYFGVALIPLLMAYTLYKRRAGGQWVAYFVIPIAMIAAYQSYTASLYTEGLLSDAAGFASSQKERTGFLGETLEGLSFVGGCLLPAVAFAPWLWSRRQLLIGLVASGALAGLVVSGWIATGRLNATPPVTQTAFHAHPVLFTLELTIFLAGGISVLALGVADFLSKKDADSLLLLLWVGGTYIFTCYFNWTVNARSVLPLLPAGGILIARRLRRNRAPSEALPFARVAIPLLATAAIGIWVTTGDSQQANASRSTAIRVQELTKGRDPSSTVWFTGHWGLQYYMEAIGARPAELSKHQINYGDYLLEPGNAAAPKLMIAQMSPGQNLDVPMTTAAATINKEVGTGFYSSNWGPLPFFLGPAPPEKFELVYLQKPKGQ